MKIHDDHLYNGAVLVQIAEDDRFTAINKLRTKNKKFENAYEINAKKTIYIKYSSEPLKGTNEFQFTFRRSHLDDIGEIADENHDTFISLVCVSEREICCLRVEQLLTLIEERKQAKMVDEEQYVIMVSAEPSKQFRVYAHVPDKKGKN